MKSFIERVKGAISLKGLVFRVFVFGASWLFFPFWMFLLVAAYIFFVPLFRPFEFIFPFLAIVFFAFAERPGFLMAVFLSVLFYLLLGIKDMVFIDRKSNYEVLALLILLLTFAEIFSRSANWTDARSLFFLFSAGAAFFFLAGGFAGECAKKDAASGKSAEKSGLIIPAVAALMVLQLSLAVVFLPLNYLYKSVIVFLALAVLMEFMSDYFCGELDRRKILTSLSFFLVVLALIFGLAQWGL